MAEWRPRKWRKLHYDFATSKKLRKVGSDALALLATMIATAWWDDESNEGRMYDAEDVPTQRADLYIGAQLTFAKGEAALEKLRKVKSVDIVDGVVVLPGYRDHQRSGSADRMKRHRARHSDGHVLSHVTHSRVQSAEAEAENPSGSPVAPKGATQKTPTPEPDPAPREPSVASPEAAASSASEQPANDLPGEESPGLLSACSPAPTSRKGKPRKPRSDVPPEFLQAAYEAFSDARETLTGFRPKGLSAEMLDQLAKLYAAHTPSVDDWRLVVRQRLAMDQRGEGYGSLTWVSLTTPKNFERWLLESQKRGDQRARQVGRAPVSSNPTTSGVLDLRSRIAKESP